MRKHQLFYGLVLIAFVCIGIFSPKPINWRVTFSPKDKNPFGVHALYQVLPNYLELEEDQLSTQFYSFSEMDTSQYNQNALILTDWFGASARDVEALFAYVEKGNTVLLGAENIAGWLSDSLGISTGDLSIDEGFEVQSAAQSATGTLNMQLRFIRDDAYPAYTFLFPAEAAKNYVIDKQNRLTPLAFNQADKLTLGYLKKGKGALYICSTPRLLTNYYFLKYKADKYAAAILAPFVGNNLVHNQFYQLGRQQAQSPLRYIFSVPPLKTAYFILLAGVFLFIFFYGKRRARIIPVLVPPKNSSLEFASTLGQLYYQQRNHKNLLSKRLRYWQSYVRQKYLLNTQNLGEAFAEELSAKSGVDKDVIIPLVRASINLEQMKHIDATVLLDMEHRLNKFYTVKK